MQLRPQYIADVYAALKGNRGPSADAEKRRAARLEVEAVVTLWSLHNDNNTRQSQTSLTRDISLTGIGLLQSFPFAPHEQFIVQLPRDKREPLLVLCQVHHIRQPAEGIFFIGAEFVRVMEKPPHPIAHDTPAATITIEPVAAALTNPESKSP